MFSKKYYYYNNYKSTADGLFAMDDEGIKGTLADIKNKSEFKQIKHGPFFQNANAINHMLDTENDTFVKINSSNTGYEGAPCTDTQQKNINDQLANIYDTAGKTINIYNHFLKSVTEGAREYDDIEEVKYIILQLQYNIAKKINYIVQKCDRALEITKEQVLNNNNSKINNLNQIISELNSSICNKNQIAHYLQGELLNLNNKLAEACKLSNSKGLYFDSNSTKITNNQLCVDHIGICNSQTERETLFQEIIKNNEVRESLFDDLFQTECPDDKLHVCNIEWFASIMLMQTDKLLQQRGLDNEVDISNLDDAARIIELTNCMANEGFKRCVKVCEATKKTDDVHFVTNKYSKIFDKINEIANDQIEFLKAEREKIQKEENDSKRMFWGNFSKSSNIRKIDEIIGRLQGVQQNIWQKFNNTAYDKDQKFIANGPVVFKGVDVSKFQCW